MTSTITSHSDRGPCCACGGPDVNVIIHLPFEAPEGFRGWGCFQCHLPLRGAVALVCERCAAAAELQAQLPPLKTICGGEYALEGVRVPHPPKEQCLPFEHNLALHPEISTQEH